MIFIYKFSPIIKDLCKRNKKTNDSSYIESNLMSSNLNDKQSLSSYNL